MTATFDTTFGTTAPGYTFTNFDGNVPSYASQVIDSNNNIYVTGYITINNIQKLILVKYTNTGALDKTFGAGKGYIIGDYYFGKVSYGNSLVLDSTGNIIVTGTVDNNGVQGLLLAKYKSNGELDKSFGGNGTGWANITDSNINSRFGYSLAIDKKTGSIVILASKLRVDQSAFMIVKFTINGLLDTNFGRGKGYIYTENDKYSIDIDNGGNITLDNSGGILITGFNSTLTNIILKYTPNGELDTAFGENNGYTYTKIPKALGSYGNSLVIDSTNSIVILSSVVYTVGKSNSALLRYNSNGIIDSTFGDNGIAVLDFVQSLTQQVSLDNNGRLVVCGLAYNYKKDNGALVARFLNNTVEPICLVAGTPILTDQGLVPIELIQPNKHTISNKAIVAITKTVTPEKVLVCFEANSLGINCPMQRTIMTSGHEVLYKGQLVQAKHFLGRADGVHTVPYNGKDVLYNVLQEQHGLMRVNNMVLETLHPENKVAKQILGNLN